ncbi:TetR/AcrR family transcriptional regulator [Brevibacterium renqingii]|uniref:TetR/AcrR family transcriptional regulator n=1 Tax=Brevibacterium renqingii TaxID=2776916 RepID=UPI001AE08551|nr:TetR/AcrR family transcriptional regulator [Brevibacterium renqingii]
MSKQTEGTVDARNQADRTAVSRELILDATIECLLREGYSATTTVKVQSLAGVTRGRLLHHFPSKQALLTAAVARLGEQRLDRRLEDGGDELDHMLDAERPADDEVGPRIDWAIVSLWTGLMHKSFFSALELWTASRTDDELADSVRSHEKVVLDRVRDNAKDLFGPVVAAAPDYDEIFTMLFASMRGMAVTYTFSRRDPRHEPMIGTWQSVARSLLSYHLAEGGETSAAH